MTTICKKKHCVWRVDCGNGKAICSRVNCPNMQYVNNDLPTIKWNLDRIAKPYTPPKYLRKFVADMTDIQKQEILTMYLVKGWGYEKIQRKLNNIYSAYLIREVILQSGYTIYDRGKGF